MDEPRPIRPARRPLDARVVVPGSKSVTNRWLLLAALAGGRSRLHGVLEADDTLAFAEGLRALGFAVARTAPGEWSVEGAGGGIPAAAAEVDCAEAGTAARFLLAACAAGHGEYHFDASPQLRRRPLGALLDALRAQGAATEPQDAAALPLALRASGLSGGVLRLPGGTSSQFVSALLMAAPLGRAPLELHVDGLVSRPYVDMTLAMMAEAGVTAGRDGYDVFTVAPAAYRAGDRQVEPDASTASYFFAAAAVSGGRVQVPGLRRRGCLQGDVAFVDALACMGCEVRDEPDGLTVRGPAVLDGLTLDMADISDTFMTLACVAPFATSPVTITGIANTRLKESDRIAAVAGNLERLGVPVRQGPDWLTVFPATPHAGVVDPHGDHRLAMSFAVLGLRAHGVIVADPGCVAKTCPSFFELWSELEQEPA